MNSPTDNSVIELWNIVFVEHCQDISGKLKNRRKQKNETKLGRRKGGHESEKDANVDQ